MKSLVLLIALLCTTALFAQNEIYFSDGSPGFSFEITDGKVWTSSVIEESHAYDAGMTDACQIIKINGKAIPDTFEYNLIKNQLLGALNSEVVIVYVNNEDTIFSRILRDQVSYETQLIDSYLHFIILKKLSPKQISVSHFEDIINNPNSNISLDSVLSLENLKLIPDAKSQFTTLKTDPNNYLIKQGVKKGDRILSINGKPFSEHGIRDMIRVNHNHDTMLVEIESLDTKKTLMVKVFGENNDLFQSIENSNKLNDFWSIIPIKPNCSENSSFIIESEGNTKLDCYYISNNEWKHLSSDDHVEWLEQKVMKNKSYIKIFPHSISHSKIYLHQSELNNQGSVLLTIYPWEMALQKDVGNRLIQGLFFGIMMIMALYNLILTASFRDRNYLFFSLYILFFGLYMIANKGYLLPELVYKIDKEIFLLISMLFFLIYMQSYLRVKQFIPKWNKVFIILSTFLLIVLAILILFPLLTKASPSWIMTLIGLTGFISGIIYFVLFIPTIKLISKNKAAINILTANIVLVFSGLISLAQENNAYIQAGVVVQILIFSVGLGQRIANNEKQKNKALKRAVAQLKVNDELREKVNLELEQKVKERTEDLEQANVEIQAQRDNLKIFNDEVSASINYAEKIQRSILPDEQLLKDNFADHFILFKPRDVVSGDFYWFKKINNHIIVTAADCTGHGVPGAFMSMLGISFLNEIVSKNRFDETNIILDRLRSKVKSVLKQKGEIGENKDGMDMAICTINMETLELQYSGAYNPLYIIRDNELITLKADRQPIAVYINEKPFNLSNIQLQEGDCLYMFSDGYADQFGGKNGKKFMSKNLKQLLLNYHTRPMNGQKEVYLEKFETWKKGYEQMDDVILMGLKV